MKALGVGWTVQDAMYFGGEQFVQQAGAEAARRVPPVDTGRRRSASPIGAGTDAHRVASYNPFTALQWFLDGKTVERAAIRGPEETPSRADALRFYTIGSAWFSRDEQNARLARGRQARRPRRAVQGLHDRAGRPDRRHRIAAHDGRRQDRLCGRAVSGAREMLVRRAADLDHNSTRLPSGQLWRLRQDLQSIAHMDLQLAGKVAIVTGASRGIGRAIAQTLAAEGMRLALAARSRDQLEELAGSLDDAVRCVQAVDLREPDAPAAVVAAAIARFGGLDLLVNNAGATRRGDFLDAVGRRLGRWLRA